MADVNTKGVDKLYNAVIERFESETGLKAKRAWALGFTFWQVEAEDGSIYSVRW